MKSTLREVFFMLRAVIKENNCKSENCLAHLYNICHLSFLSCHLFLSSFFIEPSELKILRLVAYLNTCSTESTQSNNPSYA